MENLPQLVPLIIIIPALGAIINYFWGGRLGERWSSGIAIFAAVSTFVVSLLLYSYLLGSNFAAAVVNPPFLDGWLRIESIGFEIAWQQRVDTLSVTMMLIVTGVGSLIHIYARGYMHGDEKFPRFFAYLNMFLAFMLILVSGNNFLMMFVGWEGVGLCSYLLISFWWDKPGAEGWKNSNAGRKAFIANRVGDFGVLLAMFLIFTTFGTLDFYRAGEIANPEAAQALHAEAAPEGEAAPSGHEAPAEESAPSGHEAAPATEESASSEHDTPSEEGAMAEGESGHGESVAPAPTDNEHIPFDELGVFGQAERLLALEEGETLAGVLYRYNGQPRIATDEEGAPLYDADGNPVYEERGREVYIGSLKLDITTVITLITLFMLLGAAGKSAQIPLFVWLPDAMAGPTPVSALIHAATMVTAGVYMMVRSSVFFHAADLTSLIVTLIGAGTALMAGFIAIGQWDIKRVLAYSTISQLGFMVAAVGVGAYIAAMFHLVTHAFFKALLFLGSGSVIHGVEHGAHHAEEHIDPQDMRHMGGLKHRMPITYFTYLIGTLALAGIFPFAGFWSKDEILADAWQAGIGGATFFRQISGYIALALLAAAAAFTAFYMWRQMELVFFGEPRSEAAKHAHESGWFMTIPLLVLGLLSVFGGFFNTPKGVLGLDGIFGAHRFGDFITPSVPYAHIGEFNWLLALGALGLGLGAIFVARSIYGQGKALTADGRDPLQVKPETSAIWSLAHARLYWDEFYDRVIIRPFQRLGTFLADTLDWAFLHDYVHDTVIYKGFNTVGDLLSRPIDLGVIDGVVNGLGRFIAWLSGQFRKLQTGYVRTYAVALLLGVVVVLIIMLLPLTQSG